MTRAQFRPADHPHEAFLLTTVVGSHPRPPWLDAIQACADDGHVEASAVDAAIDDAVRLAVRDYERAGLDVVTDGELRRDGMVEHFTAFIDGYEPGTGSDGPDWNGHMPTVTDTPTATEAFLVDDFTFADGVTTRPVKVTLPGPFTFASFCSLEAYDSVEALIADFTEVVRNEVARLVGAGATWIQLDEPALGMSPHVDIARESVTRIASAVPDDVRLGLHVCSGNYDTLAPAVFDFPVDEVDLEFASDDADPIEGVLGGVDLDIDVSVGVVDSQDKRVESVEEIRARVREALRVVPPDRLTLTPDCGLKPLPSDVAIAKVERLTTAARAVERDLDANRLQPAVAD
ncbi:MAG: methionine synthase [archaeon]